MIPANPDRLSRTEIKAAFRKHYGEKSRLAKQIGVILPRVSEWFSNENQKPTKLRNRIDAAIRQRAAELINAERAKASGGCS